MAGTLLISDLHLGSGSGSDALKRRAARERLYQALGDIDRLVLLGDALELRDSPMEKVLASAKPFFTELGAHFAGEIVIVPGNHDHRLLGPWVDRARGDTVGSIELDQAIEDPHPAVVTLRDWVSPARLEVRYPGLWVREDVYAMHGHYVDSHVTLPTIERLSVATFDRLSGRPTGARARPLDYEQVHAPIYDLIFSLAQGGRSMGGDEEGKSRAMKIWETLGGASGRARTLQGRVLGSAVIPAALRGMELAGLGRFSRDFSVAEIGRAGVVGMHTVIESLGVEADHVVFGHIHRRGATTADASDADAPEWRRNGVTLHNTGNWVYTDGLLGRAGPRSPFWPGTAVLVPESGPPELIELLADMDREVLAGRAGRGD